MFLPRQGPEATPMVFDDSTRERKAESGSGVLGREKYVEDARPRRGLDAWAGIADLEQHVAIRERRRANRDVAKSALRCVQGFYRIGEKVDEHLLQLGPI